MPAPGRHFAFSNLTTIVRRGDCPHITNEETEVWTALEACKDSSASGVEGRSIPGLGLRQSQPCLLICLVSVVVLMGSRVFLRHVCPVSLHFPTSRGGTEREASCVWFLGSGLGAVDPGSTQ